MSMNGKSVPPEMRGQTAGPCMMVIFGATGDLAKRLLVPALCNLGNGKLLSENFSLVGFSKDEYSKESFQAYMKSCIEEFVTEPGALAYGLSLVKHMDYVQGAFDDPKAFETLGQRLADQNALFYMATPPTLFSTIVDQLGQAGLTREEGRRWRRVIIEKPFGRDLKSAKELNAQLQKVLTESQIYRIDHYLGKETVQNLLAFRFANGIFEPIWNRRYIDHVQITVGENLGVELRGAYYEQAGALRDMIPNHLFQLLSYIAMEPPISLDADAVRDEKAKVLRAVQELSPEAVLTCTARGQYDAGTIDDKPVQAYRSEPKVDPKSVTETFVAMRLFIDNWRWAGVPFYLRTGKRLAKRETEIAIQFKTAPSIMFKNTESSSLSPNLLVVHVQPEEGISLRFGAKVPGPIVRIGDVDMKFKYKDYFGSSSGTGYETLLYDCMMGDGTLFQRADMVEFGWRVVEPILDVWSALAPRNFPNYAAGSFGPKEADDLIQREGRKWRNNLP